MNRICKHAHKIGELWRSTTTPTPLTDVPKHITNEDDRMRYAGWERVIDIDDNDPSNWQCGWRSADMPPPVLRAAGGNHLRAGDCDV